MLRISNKILAAAGGAALALGASNAAFAVNLPFSFDPSLVNASAALTGTAITANELVISTDSLTTFTYGPGAPVNPFPGTTFSEDGIAVVLGYQGATSFGSAYFDNAGTITSLPNTYHLFLSFHQTGTFNSIDGSGNVIFDITSLTYTLSLDVGGHGTIPNSGNNTLAAPMITGLGADPLIQIAHGSALPGGQVIENPNTPTFAEGFTSTVIPDVAAFFVAPVPFYNFSFTSVTSASVTNSQGTPPTLVLINGQQGNINFIPEPATLGIFGSALFGFGWLRRRQRKGLQKAA